MNVKFGTGVGVEAGTAAAEDGPPLHPVRAAVPQNRTRALRKCFTCESPLPPEEGFIPGLECLEID